MRNGPIVKRCTGRNCCEVPIEVGITEQLSFQNHEGIMATIKANGTEIGRWIKYDTIPNRYSTGSGVVEEYVLMSNRWILRKLRFSWGWDGWKRYARVREGVDLFEYVQKRQSKLEA